MSPKTTIPTEPATTYVLMVSYSPRKADPENTFRKIQNSCLQLLLPHHFHELHWTLEYKNRRYSISRKPFPLRWRAHIKPISTNCKISLLFSLIKLLRILRLRSSCTSIGCNSLRFDSFDPNVDNILGLIGCLKANPRHLKVSWFSCLLRIVLYAIFERARKAMLIITVLALLVSQCNHSLWVKRKLCSPGTWENSISFFHHLFKKIEQWERGKKIFRLLQHL